MSNRFNWRFYPAAMARRSILSILVGLMGGGCAVLAQQVPDAASSASPAPAAELAPAAEIAPAPQASAPVEPSVTVSTPVAGETGADVANAPAATPVTAAMGPDGKPLASGKGKKLKKVKKEKPPKMTPMNVAQGTLTVDGWTGKARMNYDIADLKYVYMWAPGVGTVVVSNTKFPLGKEQKNAFSGNTLTVDASGHTLQLYSQKRLLNVKKPVSAYVYLDTSYQVASSFPVMGYGTTTQAPYAWPGAKNVQVGKGTAAPPLPANLRTVLATSACVPAGSKAAGTPCSVVKPTAAASTPTPAASIPTAAVVGDTPIPPAP